MKTYRVVYKRTGGTYSKRVNADSDLEARSLIFAKLKHDPNFHIIRCELGD